MNNSIIKFYRAREVQLPSRGHAYDAGIDFFVPSFSGPFIKDLKKVNPSLNYDPPTPQNSGTIYCSSEALTLTSRDLGPSVSFKISDSNDTIVKYDESTGKCYFLLAPLSRVNIPSGIYCLMAEPGRALIAANKSGIASKHGLIFGAQVVDYQYQGEIHINVINTSSEVVRIYEGQKLIQFVETPVFTSEIQEEEHPENLFRRPSTRGAGGFGSTDADTKDQDTAGDVKQINS